MYLVKAIYNLGRSFVIFFY